MLRYLLPLMFVSSIALADAPPGVDLNSPTHRWFEQQYNMDNNNCCGLGDGHILEADEWKNLGDHYEVKINNKWFTLKHWQKRDIKPDVSGHEPLRGTASPFDKAIVWYKYYSAKERIDNTPHIYCFSPWEFLE